MRTREEARTKSPGAREPLDPTSTSMFYTATGAFAAMYAPTEGAAAREVAASAASGRDEGRPMSGVYPGSSASMSSEGSPPRVYAGRGWRGRG
jgi:hypothetical protein